MIPSKAPSMIPSKAPSISPSKAPHTSPTGAPNTSSRLADMISIENTQQAGIDIENMEQAGVEYKLQITVVPDSYPDEISWTITSSDETVLQEGTGDSGT